MSDARTDRNLTPDELREALTVDGAVSIRALLACAFEDAPPEDRRYAATLVTEWRKRRKHV